MIVEASRARLIRFALNDFGIWRRGGRGRYSSTSGFAFEIRLAVCVFRMSGWSAYESRRSGARSRGGEGKTARLIYRPISPPYRVRFSGASHLTDDIPTKTGARVKTSKT